MSNIVICVCTRERPKMLDACLLSLMHQRRPDGTAAPSPVGRLGGSRGRGAGQRRDVECHFPGVARAPVQPDLL